MATTTSSSTAVLSLQQRIQAQLEDAKASVLAPSAKRIYAKAGQIYLPDGSVSPNQQADIIILTWRWMNRYYPNAYNPNLITAPACFAIGNAPDTLTPECDSPQHTDCSGCPKNQFKSAPGGGAGKACRNQVIVAGIRGDGLGDLFTVTLAPTSIQAFSKYVIRLANAKLLPIQVVTQLKLDTTVSYPKFIFEPGSPVDETNLLNTLERQDEANEYLGAKTMASYD